MCEPFPDSSCDTLNRVGQVIVNLLNGVLWLYILAIVGFVVAFVVTCVKLIGRAAQRQSQRAQLAARVRQEKRRGRRAQQELRDLEAKHRRNIDDLF